MNISNSVFISGYIPGVFISKPISDSGSVPGTDYWVTEDDDNIVTEDGDLLIWSK